MPALGGVVLHVVRSLQCWVTARALGGRQIIEPVRISPPSRVDGEFYVRRWSGFAKRARVLPTNATREDRSTLRSFRDINLLPPMYQYA